MASRSRVAVTKPDTDDDYDAPAAPAAASQAPRQGSRVVKRGWGAPAREERQETVKAEYLKLKDNGHRIIKVMNAVPPVHYFQHFVNSMGQSFTCARIWEGRQLVQACPLCEAGHKASARFMLNVVDMETPEIIRKWDFGNEVSGILQGYSVKPNGEEFPIDDENRYFEVYHRSVAGRKAPSTQVDRLKASDLHDDYGILPLTSQEIEELRGEPVLD